MLCTSTHQIMSVQKLNQTLLFGAYEYHFWWPQPGALENILQIMFAGSAKIRVGRSELSGTDQSITISYGLATGLYQSNLLWVYQSHL